MRHPIATTVLLCAGVAIVVLCALATLVMRDGFVRLHYVGAASLLGGLPIAAALVVEDGTGPLGVRAVIALLALLVSGPVASHATARAGRLLRGQSITHARDREAP